MATPGPAGAVVIVVAAGSSRRVGFDKLDAPVAGRPLLAWTLEALAAAPGVGSIVVVTAPDRVDAVGRAAWLPGAVTAVVPGGARRHESVAAGVAAVAALRQVGMTTGQSAGWTILVHDGARPLVPADLVNRVIEAVRRHGAAVPVLPVVETVKRVGADGLVIETVDRTTLATAQTPQGARLDLFEAAFARFPPDGPETWTDEAALLEACTIPVHVVPGDSANIKVTTAADLDRVELALRGGSPGRAATPAVRVGYGTDSHPFGPGMPLVLGGVVFDGAPALHGHSDGDVVLHAIADALLGAAALGDLGRHFPAGPATPAGIASDVLLRAVVDRLLSAGRRPAAIDVTIVAARPRLAARLDEMSAAIAAILGLTRDRVNVKASTGNLAGMEGAGRGISATAVATIEPLS